MRNKYQFLCRQYIFVLHIKLLCYKCVNAQQDNAKFHVIAFYTAREDLAHISFVHEANKWFSEMALTYKFAYDSTNNWDNLNAAFLSHYQVVLFLDTRPDSAAQRDAFNNIWIAEVAGWDFIFRHLRLPLRHIHKTGIGITTSF